MLHRNSHATNSLASERTNRPEHGGQTRTNAPYLSDPYSNIQSDRMHAFSSTNLAQLLLHCFHPRHHLGRHVRNMNGVTIHNLGSPELSLNSSNLRLSIDLIKFRDASLRKTRDIDAVCRAPRQCRLVCGGDGTQASSQLGLE
jgi:hypothetical protein